jgi:nitrogen fixation protein
MAHYYNKTEKVQSRKMLGGEVTLEGGWFFKLKKAKKAWH